MGYYTMFELELKDVDWEIAEPIISELRESNECAKEAIDENGDAYESTKWYGFREDMINFSKQYPDILFILRGVGEENDDIWKEHFKNGECTRYGVRIIYDDGEEYK